MKRLVCLILLILLYPLGASALEIKVALVAPEGSTWTKIIRKFDQKLRTDTQGRLGLKIYAGGVSGDEKDVIRKMRIGQLHAAGFTGVGLGEIYPAVRLFELPMFFENYAEVDFVTSKLQKKLETGFAQRGYILLGWAEAGFVNIFSNQPIRGLKDLQGIKMWAWEGDPLVQEMYRVLDVVPVPLSLPDVLTALQTGMVEGVYVPPLGAIAMQWFAKARYMTEIDLADSTGALLITKRAWNTISPADQKILKRLAATYCRELVETTRRDNQKSLDLLKKAGIEMIKVDPAERSKIHARSAEVWQTLAGKLYPPELLAEAKKYLANYRNNQK